MATRRETTERRRALYDGLRNSCRDGSLRAGEMVPPVRELVQQYNLSLNVVREVLALLVDEGVLYSVPRVGTFAGKPQFKEAEVFLLILPWEGKDNNYICQIQMGFEERVAEMGGVSVMLAQKQALSLYANRELPAIRGLFEVESSQLTQRYGAAGVPCVCFGNLQEQQAQADFIHFDDIDGGAQATRHLLSLGHRRIAFLGLDNPENDEIRWRWSAERAAGWRQVIAENGGDTTLRFNPDFSPGSEEEEQIAAAQETARALVHRSDLDAVVVANGLVLEGLYSALREAKISLENWPAIVSFDERPMNSGSVTSYLRLPWEVVGREAAEIIHGRAASRVVGPPQQSVVPMRLIPRLSCRENWTELSQLLTINQSLPNLSVPVMTGKLIEA